MVCANTLQTACTYVRICFVSHMYVYLISIIPPGRGRMKTATLLFLLGAITCMMQAVPDLGGTYVGITDTLKSCVYVDCYVCAGLAVLKCMAS